ncbi:MAG: hypothetical protein J6T57_02915 [Alphaproteobacteria bacterium]|nr:hypothetical protein [Alphaproteobacteria bacterium]
MVDRKLDYDNDYDQQRLGSPFLIAMKYRPQVGLYESDLRYIDYNIKSHPLFRYVNGKVFGREKNRAKISDEESINTKFVQIVFYERIIKDSNCPPRVYYVIKTLLGQLYEGLIQEFIYITDEHGNPVVDKNGNKKTITAEEIFALRRPCIERWLERSKAWS